MQRHDLLAQAQADAGTLLLGGEEGYKYFLLHVGQDATTIVGHTMNYI